MLRKGTFFCFEITIPLMVISWLKRVGTLSCCNSMLLAAASLQLCPTLCDPIDGSPPGSSVPGSLQARIPEWVAISFSNACMHPKSLQSCPTLCDAMDSSPPGSSIHRILQARILGWVAIFIGKSQRLNEGEDTLIRKQWNVWSWFCSKHTLSPKPCLTRYCTAYLQCNRDTVFPLWSFNSMDNY